MKPEILSEEQIMELEPRFKEMDSFVCDGTDFDKVAQAQRDADVEWYDLLRNKDADQCCQAIADARQEARQETAKEIFGEIEKYSNVERFSDSEVELLMLRGKDLRTILEQSYQSLKSKYTGGLNGK